VPRAPVLDWPASDRRTDLAAPRGARESDAASVRLVDVRRSNRDLANCEAHAAVLADAGAANSLPHRTRAPVRRATTHRARPSPLKCQYTLTCYRDRPVAVHAAWRSLATRA